MTEQKAMSDRVPPVAGISLRVWEKICDLFTPSECVEVCSLLAAYRTGTKEADDRIRLDVLEVSGGTIDGVKRAMRLANADYRDVIVAAEYELIRGKYVKKESRSH
jgi:hypothetical protein